jgi:hypothetical protein
MTTKEKETVKTAELNFSEAPSSWNTRYISPDGFDCQITLRGENGSELLERASNAIAYLLKNGCKPYTFYRSGNRQNEHAKKESNNGNNRNGREVQQSDKAWCPIHEREMRRWEKEVDQRLYLSSRNKREYVNRDLASLRKREDRMW